MGRRMWAEKNRTHHDILVVRHASARELSRDFGGVVAVERDWVLGPVISARNQHISTTAGAIGTKRRTRE